jgi:ribonuclease D
MMMSHAPAIHFYHNDLPAEIDLGDEIAVDLEMMGLNLLRDRTCLIQLRGRDTDIHIVQFSKDQKSAPNLQKILENPASIKMYHFARIDIASLKHWLGIDCKGTYCTKIVSKLVRTYTDRHGLREVVREVIGIELNKNQANTNWSQPLSKEQLDYAASDVLYLHAVKDYLHAMLVETGRVEIAQACFDFLPTRAMLDLIGWHDYDIFQHT